MDKRRVPRISVDWKVSLHAGKQVTHGRAIQFSEYGMLVAPPDAVQVGHRYDLHFSVPGQKAVFRVRCIGVYSSSTGAGIRFEHVPPDITASLRNCVSSLAADTAGN